MVKNSLANAGDIRDVGLISGFRRSPGKENGSPLQDSCLANPMDRGLAGYGPQGQRGRHNWRDLACTAQGIYSIRARNTASEMRISEFTS